MPIDLDIKDVVRKKVIPTNYSTEINDVIDMIAFDKEKVQVLGSMSFRSMLYSSDYDLYEIVNEKSIKTIAKKYQNIIKKIKKKKNIMIGDIKIGQIDEWEIIDEYEDLENYNYDKTKQNIQNLYNNKIISADEYNNYMKHLLKNPSQIQFIKMKKELRPHILRWKPKEILNGQKMFRNHTITLERALDSDGLFKMDLIVKLSTGVLQEISIIYELRVNSVRVSSKRIDVPKSLEEAIVYYTDKGQFFKVCKRMFSLFNYNLLNRKDNRKDNVDMIEKLFYILNSDIGIIYQVVSNIEVMIEAIEDFNFDKEKLKPHIDDFINNLSNVWSSNLFLKNEDSILNEIKIIVKSKNKSKVINGLNKVKSVLNTILNKETSKMLETILD